MPRSVIIAVIFILTLFMIACDNPANQQPSTNADLSDLSLSTGTLSPAFTKANTAYSVSVPNTTTGITITGTKADSNASLSSNNGVNQDLPVGDTAITITVTAQDGTSTKKYVVTVTRAAATSAGTDPAPGPGANTSNVPPGYALVWNDEFNGSGLPNSSKWSYDTALNYFGWGNGEKQFYTEEDLDNVYQSGGLLHIVALLEDNSEVAWDWEDGTGNITYNYEYSSARLNSHPNNRTYGFIEVRAKIPGGEGTWPAIWMVGLGTWPDCGEIDLMEQWGNDDSIGGNIHVKKYQGNTELIKHYRPEDLFSTFHKYQLLWTASKLTIMVDGVEVNSYEKDTTLSGSAAHDQWPFDEPENLILNLAIQGKGVYVERANFPIDFQIDYVRWYQEE